MSRGYYIILVLAVNLTLVSENVIIFAQEENQPKLNAFDKINALTQQLHVLVKTKENGASYDSRPKATPGHEHDEFDNAFNNVFGSQKPLYIEDNRTPIFNIKDPNILEKAKSVAALIPSDRLTLSGDEWLLKTTNFGQAYKLCETEAFRDEPIAANCSGFLVQSDIVATAGHCILDESKLNIIRFVFGYEMLDAKRVRDKFSKDDVYRGLHLISREQDDHGADWALVKLDRPVKDRYPLHLRDISTGKINDNDILYVIGYPNGLPKMYAGPALIKKNTDTAFFVAQLDTYGGNSGSPVFNINTHEVEGILVRGATDFICDKGKACTRSLICPNKETSINVVDCSGENVRVDCTGEDVTRIAIPAKFLSNITKLGSNK